MQPYTKTGQKIKAMKKKAIAVSNKIVTSNGSSPFIKTNVNAVKYVTVPIIRYVIM